MHILFVCTGNICRSPIAERLAVACGGGQIPGFTATSAGTRAVVGHAIHQDAAHVLEQLGANASDFAARLLTHKIASSADLVITMTREHRDIVLEAAPRQIHRTFTLSEAAYLAADPSVLTLSDPAERRPLMTAGNMPDIPDPIGQSPAVFATVGSQIDALLRPVLLLCKRSAKDA